MEYRSFDGTGNNPVHPEWGSVGQQLLRKTAPEYSDGISELAGKNRCNPRVVSNVLCSQGDKKIPNRRNLTNFTWAWGQFLDHELDLTGPANPPEPADMETPYNDPEIPNGRIPFLRSIYDTNTGTDGPRQQINQISAYIDATNVYGFSNHRAFALRTFDGTGKLKTSAGNLLPFNTEGLSNASPGGPSASFFLAGDIRANEHGVLTALHTLFVREHNYQCDQILQDYPHWHGNDEKIYQRARKIVGALMQVITYNEFLAALLGDGAISPYNGYQPTVNAGIANVFSTASYRVGHTMLSEKILLIDDRRHSTPIALRDAFFNPRLVIDNGIDPFFRGLAATLMQEVDTRIIESVRSFLFFRTDRDEENRQLLDLAALNIQRGRDHGLANYNQCREDFGLPRVNSFAEITANTRLQSQLQSVYGSVDNIDAWLGGLAEDHVEGASVGELILAVLKDQFERLRDGDRFWYENDADLVYDVQTLKQTTLADIIRRNTDVDVIQDNVFLSADAPGNECDDTPPAKTRKDKETVFVPEEA